MGPVTERVVCFIDGSNVYSHFRDLFGNPYYDQAALCALLAGPRTLVGWRFYSAELPEGESDGQKERRRRHEAFLDFVRHRTDATLRLGRFRILKTDSLPVLVEKGVDVLIAVDLVHLAARDAYDTAIVLSADEDLVPAIDIVREHYSKRVEIALPDVPARAVREAADGYQEITRGIFEQVARR
jgi:uncharacterized LabA/DUF88 family protein